MTKKTRFYLFILTVLTVFLIFLFLFSLFLLFDGVAAVNQQVVAGNHARTLAA